MDRESAVHRFDNSMPATPLSVQDLNFQYTDMQQRSMSGSAHRDVGAYVMSQPVINRSRGVVPNVVFCDAGWKPSGEEYADQLLKQIGRFRSSGGLLFAPDAVSSGDVSFSSAGARHTHAVGTWDGMSVGGYHVSGLVSLDYGDLRFVQHLGVRWAGCLDGDVLCRC
jgi:hypothetical protein